MNIAKENRDSLRSKLSETDAVNKSTEENIQDSTSKCISEETLNTNSDNKSNIDNQELEGPEVSTIDSQENVSEKCNQKENSTGHILEESVEVTKNCTLTLNDPGEIQNTSDKTTILPDSISKETILAEDIIDDETNILEKEPDTCESENTLNEESVVETIECLKEHHLPNSVSVEGIDLNLNITQDISFQPQDITSPVTESAEEALNYISSSSTEGVSTEFEDDFVSISVKLSPAFLFIIPRV